MVQTSHPGVLVLVPLAVEVTDILLFLLGVLARLVKVMLVVVVLIQAPNLEKAVEEVVLADLVIIQDLQEVMVELV
jgi:hypothetical protein